MKTKYLFVVICLWLSGCASTQGQKIDSFPMYGQPEIVRPAELVKADQDFIHKVESELGDRKAASKVWWQQAEKFMGERNFEYAMRRYNQAWLLDPNNYQPYWGFARVQSELGKDDEAIRFLEKAKSLVNDPYQEVALLSDLGSIYSAKAATQPVGSEERKKYFVLAEEQFIKSTSLDSEYGDSWRRWAYSLFEQGNYTEAWVKVRRARELKARPFPQKFIEVLQAKQPNLN